MTPRRLVVALVVLLAAAVFALLAWLPFDPFEEPAGPIDTVIPGTVDSAWRFDGPSLVRSPFARAAWVHPDVVELRARWDVEGRFLRPMRDVERAFAAASLGLADPPSLERDLMPAEVVVATRGDDVLVASRMSPRGRAVELVRKLDPARAKKLGVSLDGPFVALRGEGGTPVWIARHRDVLLASTSVALLADATTVAERDLGGLSRVEGASAALSIGRPAGERVLGWVRPAALAVRLAPDASAAPWWAGLLRAPGASAIRAEIDLSDAGSAGLAARIAWEGGLPAAFAPLRAGLDAAPLAALAREHAPAGETIAAGGLSVGAAEAVRAIVGSQPPERQQALDAALAAAGESLDSVAASLAAHFEDGVGFALLRLREADRAVGGDDAGAVRAIPCTLVAFRLRGPDGGRAVVAELKRRAETLFGAPLGDTVEVLGDGTRIHTLERHGLGGQWELLRPAFAIRGGTFVFSTHDGALRRALASEARPAPPGAAGRTLVAGVAADPLRQWVADQAWEAADDATWRDWRAERMRIELSIPPDSPLAPEDRVTYVDARIREMRRTRRLREIPAAADAWRERWSWLDRLGDAEVAADVEGTGVALRVRLRPAEPR